MKIKAVTVTWVDGAGVKSKARLPRYAAYELAEALVLRCAIQAVTLDLGNRKTIATVDALTGNMIRWVDPVTGDPSLGLALPGAVKP